MFVARRSDRLVKMLCIRLPKVIGGQISASAKPAVYRGFHRGVFIEFKIAVVCMDSRYHRILRVYHKRESASPEPTIVHIKVFPDRFGKFYMDSADIYNPFFKNPAVFDVTVSAVATPISFNEIFTYSSLAITCGYSVTNILQ